MRKTTTQLLYDQLYSVRKWEMDRTPGNLARKLHSSNEAEERKLLVGWEVPNILSLISQNL